MNNATLRFPGYDLALDYVFSEAEINRALSITPEAVEAPDTLTFSKNVFLPLTTACKYTCAYCVYYDVPGQGEDYVHRIGRTGRAGASGIAMSFCDPSERGYLRDIEKLTKKSIPVRRDHAWADAEKSPEEEPAKPGANRGPRPGRGGAPGRRQGASGGQGRAPGGSAKGGRPSGGRPGGGGRGRSRHAG